MRHAEDRVRPIARGGDDPDRGMGPGDQGGQIRKQAQGVHRAGRECRLRVTAISIAMATYNGACFLREQLASLSAQTLPPAELVVTDDASSDNTPAIVRAFAETAPFPVHFHENPRRLGYRANFLHAIGLCASPLIALCDQDDVWEAGKLDKLRAPFAEPDVVLAFHESWLIDDAGRRLGLADIFGTPPRNAASSLFPLRNPYGFSMMFRRDLIGFGDLWERSVDNLFAQERMAHDQWLFFLASAFGTVAYVDEPLAGYRQHAGNTYGLVRPGRRRRDRARHWLGVRSRDYAPFVIAASARATILDEAAARLGAPWRDRAALAADRYRSLARHSAWRATIYGRTGFFTRLSAWLALVRDDGYGNRTRWTFGRKAALVDLACLVLPRRMLDTPAVS
jgi:glycosyltransferase involved in cell wall biosynthesis